MRSSKEIQSPPDNALRARPHALPRVALVTNIPAPYRVPVYNRVVADGRIDLTVIFCAAREPDRHWDYEKIEFKSIVLRESYFSWNGRYVHNNFDVLEQLKAIDPAVVITTGFNPTHLYAFVYACWHGRKHIFWTDGTVASERDYTIVHKWIRRIVYKHSNAFIGASDGSLELFRSYGCANERLFKAHLCVDNERFRDAPSQTKSRDLLFCGRLTSVKQPLFAIDVAERAAALAGRRISLLFVGTGELEPQLREKAADAVGVDVDFSGFATQTELPGLYGSVRIFLFPTLWDPWGVVANEACAAGLPIIATPFAGAVGEIIQDGVNAFVRSPEIEAWAAAVQRLLTDEHLYEEFSRSSLRLVAGHNYDAAAAGVINASLASLAQAA
jgi:glycosyltransferase involved in cell wall biosynthesis